MMPESEEAPTVGLGKPLTIFYRHVDSVVDPVEKPASGWFRTRAVRKLRIKNPSQLFYNHRSLGKRARLQICIYIFLLNVHMMVFGKSGLSIVQTVGCQGSPYEDPPSKGGWVWQLQLAIGIKHGGRLLSPSANGSGVRQ